MHSKIDNMGKLAYLADSIRKLHRHVFLFSAGDNFTGNPIVDMYPEKGYPMIDLMNRVGFDLSAIGNHEFDPGQDILNKRRGEAKFPFVCANIEVEGGILEKPRPYVVIKAGKCRIPVLGLIQISENGMPDSHPSRLVGLSFKPGLETAGDYLSLKKKYGILIALTHLGVEGDVALAQKYPQFDLVVGGHSHTLMKEPLIENGVMIVQTGSGLRNVGMTTLQIAGGKISARRFELISLDNVKGTRPEIQEIIHRYNDNDEMNRVVAQALTPFETQRELGYMMTDAIVSQFGVDFAFQNSGGIRIHSLPQGNILYKDIFRLDPFGNQVVTYTMTLAEIRSLIMNAFNRDKKSDLMVSGMTYTALLNENGICVDLELKDTSGNFLDPDKHYKVGMNSYIGATYVFDHTDQGTSQYETTAQTLINFLEEKKAVSYNGINRIEIRKK
jgi:2',3'-cyclic-nucleotide 2'-phosphodiesterase (5'-nucleotidase family)